MSADKWKPKPEKPTYDQDIECFEKMVDLLEEIKKLLEAKP